MAAAQAGTIYATPNVLEQSGTLFSTEALAPFRVKGKQEPVKAYAVGGELGERPVDEREDLPFVGRSEDLARLHAAIDAANNGVGSVVTVVGEAGQGKSRLVREATKLRDDVQVMVIRAEPYGSATPYRPLRDRLRSVLGIERASNAKMVARLEERLAELAPDLLPMLPLIANVAHIDVADTSEVAEIEPRFRQDRLTVVVASLMGRILVEPMVLIVEDAHWMDAASVHLLTHFLATASERPWTIIVTRRLEEGGLEPESGVVIEVDELPEGEAKQLVLAATRATPLHPHEVRAIVERTGGNPLFIGEVLRIVRETGRVDVLPDSLGSLVSTSIDALPPLTRRILRYASVLGRSFRTSTVSEILAEDDLELDAATRELLRDFLEPSGKGRLRFRTAMVRDVAYDGLSFRRREDLHRRAARAIEKTAGGTPDEAADQLAMHYSLGNDHLVLRTDRGGPSDACVRERRGGNPTETSARGWSPPERHRCVGGCRDLDQAGRCLGASRPVRTCPGRVSEGSSAHP
jgi:predicted ATPase